MSNRPSLVILGSAVTALAVARDARRRGLRPLVVDRSRGIAFQSRRAECFCLAEADVLDRICALARSESEARLVATSDEWLRFVAAHRADLDSSFREVWHPSNEALAVCLDKVAFARWCVAHGVPSPEIRIAEDAAAMCPPCVIRPGETRHGAEHVPKAAVAANEEELRGWLTKFAAAGVAAVVSPSLLTQPVSQLSVLFARRGGITLAFAARKLRPSADRCAVGTCVEAVEDGAAVSLARRVVEALDCQGMGEVEILRQEKSGRDWVIEVNPRPWTQYALAAARGYDLIGFLCGETPRVPPPRRVRWLDFTSDLYAVFSRSEGMRSRGEITLGQYARSLLSAGTFAKLDFGDLRPFVADLRELVSRVWRKRVSSPRH